MRVKKETEAQVFSCEFCNTSKNTFFYRTRPDDCFRVVTVMMRKVSGLQLYQKETPTQVFSYEIYEFFKNNFLKEQLYSGGCFWQ